MSKSGMYIRPSKRVEEWETVDDLEAARERVDYWADFVTKRGFGERFGFCYKPYSKGYKILIVDRSIPAVDPNTARREGK